MIRGWLINETRTRTAANVDKKNENYTNVDKKNENYTNVDKKNKN